jgi:Fervidolysin N-terminal prodomain
MTWETDAATCPADVLEAIPFYPDGLGPAERGALEAHAALCLACRRELASLHGESVEGAPEGPDAERVWRRVLERIAADATGSPARAVAPFVAAPRRRQSWLRTTIPLPLAASVALALAFGTLGAIVGSRVLAPEPGYRTATVAPEEPRAAGPALDVVFREDVSAARLQEALHAIGGSVVGGPSPLGVFRVALSPGGDAEAAAAALQGAGGVATFAAARP